MTEKLKPCPFLCNGTPQYARTQAKKGRRRESDEPLEY